MSYLAIHAQDEVPKWKDAALLCKERGNPFRCIKFFQTEPYAWVNANSPSTAYIFRQYIDDVNQEAWIYAALESPAEADRVADEFIATFKDSVNQHLGTTPGRAVYVESLNEQYPTGNQIKLNAIIAFDRGFIRRLKVHCPGVRPVVFTAAIGNPDHPDAPKLLPLARECAAAKGAMGYHAYHTVYRGQSFVLSAAHQRDLHLRWAVTFDAYFVSQGVYVDWFLGEGGATGCDPDGYNPGVLTGWKHPNTWNNDRGAYVQDLANLDLVLESTVAAKQGRLLGLTLFTSKVSPGRWQYFNLIGDDLMAVAEYVSMHPTPPPAPIPPPSTPLPITPLSQRDPRWAAHIMGPDSTGRVRNIGDFGCLVTDWCMMLQQWGISQMNPAELWEHIKATGGTNGAYLKSGSLAAAFPGKVKYNGYTGGGPDLYAQIRANKDKGWITPVRVDFNPTTPTQEEHWVNIINYLPDDNFTAADPWAGNIITVNLVYGIPGPDVLTAQWYEPVTGPTPPPRKYPRVCHLLPQDATPAEYQRVITEAYALRQSVLQSIDDALITHPNLTSRTVNVWGALSRHGAFTDRASFEAWIVANYPPLPELIYRSF